MPRIAKYPRSHISWEQIRGQVIRIPKTVGIQWLVLPDQTSYGNVIKLMALPSGKPSEANISTIKAWLDRGEMEIVPVEEIMGATV